MDQALRHVRSIEQVNQVIEVLANNEVSLERFIPNIQLSAVGLVLCAIVVTFLKKTVVKEDERGNVTIGALNFEDQELILINQYNQEAH